MRVNQRDRLGSVSHASRRCASGSNGTIDIPVVVQRKGVGADGTEGSVFCEASSPNSLGPKRDWPEVRGEECRPRTVLSWLLAKWVMGESEEAERRTLSSHGPENP